MRNRDLEPEQDDKAERVVGKPVRAGSVQGPTFVMRLQRSAGNRAVAGLLASRAARRPVVAQRDAADGTEGPDPQGGTQPTDSSLGGAGLCADPIMTVDPSGIGQTAGGAASDQTQTTDSSQPVQTLSAQTLSVQRDGPTPGQGGGATASVPTVSWPDFADAGEDQEFAAQSAWIFGFSGSFSVTKDPSNMWAKPSAKNDTTNGPALLRHEQYHFNLAGVMASKATVAQGSRPTSQADFNRLMASTNRTSRQYDSETNHGLNSGPQSTWEGNIDGGNLPYP